MLGRKLIRPPRASVASTAKVNKVVQEMLAIVRDLPREKQLWVLREAAKKHGIDFDALGASIRARPHRRGRE